jgi:hypothetical protein
LVILPHACLQESYSCKHLLQKRIHRTDSLLQCFARLEHRRNGCIQTSHFEAIKLLDRITR